MGKVLNSGQSKTEQNLRKPAEIINKNNKLRNGNYRKNEKENLEIKKYNNGNERFARQA